ncbi:hypothetical protein EC546_04685 [Helicobacter pylori]|nr:hypothetical protein EC546_04685 [Helicobacter pylori]
MPPTNTLISLIFLWIFNLFWYNNYLYLCIYVFMYLCIYVFMYLCIYVFMYLYIYVFMYLCIYVFNIITKIFN